MEAGEFCVQCNIAAIYWQYAHHVLPVIRAMKWDDVIEHAGNDVDAKLDIDEFITGFHKRVQDWGTLITTTFHEGGSRYVISDYCK